MRTIDKPNTVPTELKIVQNEIASELFRKKENFRWQTEHYNSPIKEDLKELYNNKCAICEIILTETDAENKFTVEHYRPKDHYYWLGAEWTNLFPTCVKCNGNKKDTFPLRLEKNKIGKENAPFKSDGKLDIELCNASNLFLLKEQPYYLHPEIDAPEKYFRFEPSGKVHINEDKLPDRFEIMRAKIMIDKFLKRPSLEEKRKRKINTYKDRLTNLLTKIIPIINNGYKEKDIRNLFLDFFTDLINQKEKTNEFSLLGYYMIIDFNTFFLKDIEDMFGKDLRMLVGYAYNLFIDNKIKSN